LGSTTRCDAEIAASSASALASGERASASPRKVSVGTLTVGNSVAWRMFSRIIVASASRTGPRVAGSPARPDVYPAVHIGGLVEGGRRQHGQSKLVLSWGVREAPLDRV
jgi:hypothetical protein